MRRFIRFFLSALAFAVIFGGPTLEAQTAPVRRATQSVVRLGNTGPLPVSGEGTVTSGGVRYWDIHTGTGAVAAKGKIVKIHYRGWNENGKEFINSVKLGEPAIFRLGAGQKIKGWDEGVEGMRVGGTRQLSVPPGLA